MTTAPGADESAVLLWTRTWAALSALGAGLVLIGTGAPDVSRPGGATLVALGALEAGWAVLALRGPLPRPHAALGGLALGAGVVVVGGVTGVAQLVALALQLAGAVLVAGHVRGQRREPAERTGRPAGTWQRLAVLTSGAALVAVVTVPGLAGTDAGAHAVPHGSHGAAWLGGTRHHHG
ncbi:hypothetical protein [Cellulomonas sp. HZM]|uniref:hypothetical protein n=1 Tax=Cellulomonas sp. HZM TaxID=1454010 RepID=UPI0004937600|nr:hypothetical protein [Cellulomonas sp. HZM]